ncbi:MAG: glutaredoxin family protein [Actinobacteria bacterium]|uniref:glutaredoxin family protein n=1 Tax=Candidatus Planktophila lacus TaxID=1884913 RepID=UPI000BAC698D|nr:glutaredoxin family protein [Candidatus Planktophila lacus]MCX6442270.1 glutaredoxin family protein [Actinomycetota bacterium]
MKPVVTVYSRSGCHLCENVEVTLAGLTEELNFDLEIKLIDGSPELEKLYGHEVPVIHINGEHHDFFRVDVERFRSSLEIHHQRR